jgi:Ulp1 family protease
MNKWDRIEQEPQIEVQCISLTTNALQELKYFAVGEETEDSAGEEPSSSSYDPENNPDVFVFVAMRVTPDEKNGLQKVPNAYSQNKCPEHRYIVLEFRSDKDMKELLEEMRKCPPVSPYAGSSSSLKAIDVPKYAKALMNDTKKEKASRMSVKPSAKRNAFIADRKYDDILLVYPFAGDKEMIERASDGLNEAGAKLMLEQESEVHETSTTKEPPRSVSPVPETSEDSSDNRQAIKARNRAHYLTVTVEDYERLDPGEWLNDTLIDFWMQW